MNKNPLSKLPVIALVAAIDERDARINQLRNETEAFKRELQNRLLKFRTKAKSAVPVMPTEKSVIKKTAADKK